MPNLQMLNLADVYAKADAGRAAQQQSTLRDLQTQQLLNQQRQDVGLSNLAQQSVDPTTGELDLGAMSRGAAGLGAYEQASKFQGRAMENKKRKADMTKEQAAIMGQLADENVVNDEATYQRWMGQLNEFDPKAAAAFSQKFPNYTKEAVPLLRQIGQQGMTSFQRNQLEAQKQIAKDRAAAKRERDARLKASDSNAFRAAIAESANVPFTQDAYGNVTIGALDPEKSRKLDHAKELAAQYFLTDPQLRGNHLGAAARATRESFGTGPAPAGAPGAIAPGGKFAPMTTEETEWAKRGFANPATREKTLENMKRRNYDTSFLTGAAVNPGVDLPASTIRPTRIDVFAGKSWFGKMLDAYNANMQRLESQYAPAEEE